MPASLSPQVETTDNDYKVRLEIFEGPLDLLLYLIKKDEIGIYDVSIERITSQYLAYIETFKALNIELASEFIVMAANLMYLKSRELLPKDLQPPDAEAEEDDPRWELIRQLVEYKKFKDAAQFLGVRDSTGAEFFATAPEAPDLSAPMEGIGQVGIFDLIRAFQKVLKRFEDAHTLREIVDDRWTVSDKIDHLLATVPIGGRVKFEALFNEATSRSEVIVTFLAMLELMKLHFLEVEQTNVLGGIVVLRPADKVNEMAAPLPSEMAEDHRATASQRNEEAPVLALEA
jgi:segregation and condensation protein A